MDPSRSRTVKTKAALAASLTALLAASGCSGGTDVPNTEYREGEELCDCPTTELDLRVIDYNEALRSASLKLTGRLPTLDAIIAVRDAGDDTARRTEYEERVDAMIDSPQFTLQMMEYWRNVLKMLGNGIAGVSPNNKEQAINFATAIVVEERPWTELLTAQSQTCASYNANDNTFNKFACVGGNGTGMGTPGNNNNASNIPEGQHVGILTHPAYMQTFYGNLGFNRNRYIQESFTCRSANSPAAEPTTTPSQDATCYAANPPGDLPHGVPPNYQSPWPMGTIGGACNHPNVEHVDFHEANDAIACANCHGTWNRRAPHYAMFNSLGAFSFNGTTFAVHVPVPGEPFAIMRDYLTPGTKLAWKHTYTRASDKTQVSGELTAEVPSLASYAEMAQKMVDDREVVACAVKRAWNFAMSRGDIVAERTSVPDAVIDGLVDGFVADNYNYKEVIRAIFKHDDFVNF